MRNINQFVKALNQKIGENKNITYDFFATFSRIEFALKHTGYAKSDRNRNAVPDWERFGDDHDASFRIQLDDTQNIALINAVDYLFNNPPRRLKYANGKLKWEDQDQNTPRNLNQLLLIVRAIRNNLFHGSKSIIVFNEPSRDRDLLSSAMLILNDCLNISDELKSKFLEEQ